MSIIERTAAWCAVVGMPAVAWVLTQTAWTWWYGRDALVHVDDLVAIGAAGVGATVAGYLAITGWAMVISALAQGGTTIPQSIASLTPTAWQRVTATALGITMSAGLAGPALASPPSAPHLGWDDTVATEQATPQSLAVGFAPAPPRASTARHDASPQVAPPHPDTPTPNPLAASNPGAHSSHTYTVTPGDSLWRITSALLGPAASDLAITRAWPQLYAANLDTIGSDPALIHPGLVLTIPDGFTP